MSHFQQVDILSQLGDVLKAIFSVWLSCGTSRAEDPLLGLAPIRVSYIMAQVRIAPTTYHAAVVERHIVQVQALVLDLCIAYGTRICPSWYEDGGFGGLVPRCLLFQTCVERVDLGEKFGETTRGPCFTL
jgi:hypothetical protein